MSVYLVREKRKKTKREKLNVVAFQVGAIVAVIYILFELSEEYEKQTTTKKKTLTCSRTNLFNFSDEFVCRCISFHLFNLIRFNRRMVYEMCLSVMFVMLMI